MIPAVENGPPATEGWLYGVLRTGPYRGHLLLGREPMRRGRAGNAPNPVSVVSPSGELVMLVPGTDRGDGLGSLADWLKEQGWML